MRLLHMVSHRGNSAEFPENTLPALRSAIALGVRFVELDVHLSTDGVPMVGNEQQFLGTLIPPLTTALRLLQGRPEVTVFAVLGRSSVARFGHDQVVSQVIRAMKPLESRCVLVSRDLATIHTARARADYPVGWILNAYDGHTRIKMEAFKPEYVFCDRELLPGERSLWRGPWSWAISNVSDLETALELGRRGADFVVTRNVRSLGEAMRAHVRKASAAVSTDTAPRAASEVYTFEFDFDVTI